MTSPALRPGTEIGLVPADPVALAPFGRFVSSPDEAGTRLFYSDCLHDRPEAAAPVLHTNCVPETRLPLVCEQVERHPLAAQCFLPLDVSRYLVLVMPSDADGAPVTEAAMAMIVPGDRGVIFNRNVWHMGASVLDRTGHFAVLMWRGGRKPDDEIRRIPPLILK
ncbi:MAG: ureidoglycolate lyase [Roseicyclus sp.]